MIFAVEEWSIFVYLAEFRNYYYMDRIFIPDRSAYFAHHTF